MLYIGRFVISGQLKVKTNIFTGKSENIDVLLRILYWLLVIGEFVVVMNAAIKAHIISIPYWRFSGRLDGIERYKYRGSTTLSI